MKNNLIDLNFTITENAAKRVAYLLSQEKPNSKLKISVTGGGCSGFQYNYDFVQEQEETDHLFKQNEALILVDDLSITNFMQNSTLDFIESLGGSYFEIRNPNSSAKCGCGNSFSI